MMSVFYLLRPYTLLTLSEQKLPRIITVAMKQLDPAPKTRSLRLANLNVLVNAILYNTHAAFQIIEGLSPNFSRLVFDKWFESMNEPGGLPRVHDMKLSIMAMCGLLELEESSIPPALKEGWASIVPALMAVFKQLPDAVMGAFPAPARLMTSY
jgi:hypothetical protein